MKIKVEQRHIDAGVKCAPCGCPIALALMDAVPHGPEDRVSVGTDSCGVEPHGRSYLPRAAREFIARFDCDMAVEPFEFEVKFNPDEAVL
jgi:hypothetical protein